LPIGELGERPFLLDPARGTQLDIFHKISQCDTRM
jgi:hypothetical protein